VTTLTAIILLSPCFLVTVLLLFLAAVRYINYRERAALAQYGALQNEEPFWDRLSQRSPQGVLWAGVITAMSGLALLLGLYTIGMGPWLLGGLVPLFVGLGMVFIYFTGGAARQRKAEKEASLPESTETEEQAE
jgi:peptidoglycan/LPS O-acetylase OafA/YrhL